MKWIDLDNEFIVDKYLFGDELVHVKSIVISNYMLPNLVIYISFYIL